MCSIPAYFLAILSAIYIYIMGIKVKLSIIGLRHVKKGKTRLWNLLERLSNIMILNTCGWVILTWNALCMKWNLEKHSRRWKFLQNLLAFSLKSDMETEFTFLNNGRLVFSQKIFGELRDYLRCNAAVTATHSLVLRRLILPVMPIWLLVLTENSDGNYKFNFNDFIFPSLYP